MKVIETLGRGGFGIVEKIETDDGETLARKTFAPAYDIDKSYHPKLKLRFAREVSIQSGLENESILPIVSSDLDAEPPYFLMPLAEKTYEQQIIDDRANGSIDVPAMNDLLAGLEFLHGMGFVHRDLNPKNILLLDGVWRLSDFGAVLPPKGHTLTITENTVIRTELYCAPEQRHDFHKAQPAADIFSLGCILHDLFVGKPRTPYQQLSGDGEMGIIISKCTEINPSRRPSIGVAKELIQDYLAANEMGIGDAGPEAQDWLDRLEGIEEWTDEDYEHFAIYCNYSALKPC